MKKPSLTVAIPAHNEESNIANLIRSVISQKQRSYLLRSIRVVCDGCTDRTADVVKELALKHPIIKLTVLSMRAGKSSALNWIYAESSTDFLLTLDADILPKRDIEIELMIKEMMKSDTVNVVGGRFIPLKAGNFMGRFSNISYLSFEDAILKLNGGNNMFALIGGASLIRKKLFRSFRYPQGTISDQNYLYVMATRTNPNGFRLAKETCFLMRTVNSFRDWRILGSRSVKADRENVGKFFGRKILEEYYMPKKILVRSLLKWLARDPIGILGSISMNLFIRIFPYNQARLESGEWEITKTSKGRIPRRAF